MYYVLSGDKGKHPTIIQAFKTEKAAKKAAEKRSRAWDHLTNIPTFRPSRAVFFFCFLRFRFKPLFLRSDGLLLLPYQRIVQRNKTRHSPVSARLWWYVGTERPGNILKRPDIATLDVSAIASTAIPA